MATSLQETITERYKNFIIRESNYYDDYGAWFGFYPFVYYHKDMHDEPELLSFTYGWEKTVDACKEKIDYMADDETVLRMERKNNYETMEYFFTSYNNGDVIKWHTCDVENQGMQLYGLIGVDEYGYEYIANAYWDRENDPEIFDIEER